jgi:mono/diheme cytochrome c family protein
VWCKAPHPLPPSPYRGRERETHELPVVSSSPCARERRSGGAGLLLSLLVLLTLLLAGCATGTYPLDIFPEMHNQPSQRYLEPERRAPPPGAVPVSGARPRLTFEQAANQPNPVPQTTETLARAVELYRVNCATCHGADGRGQGPMAAYFRENPAAPVPPVDLASPRVQQRTDGHLHWLLANGIGNMPAYANLLTDQDLWALVTFVRTVR